VGDCKPTTFGLPEESLEVGETLTHPTKTDIVCYSIAFLGLVIFCCLNLEKVPITGRLRFNFMTHALAGDSNTCTAQLHALGEFLVPDHDSRVIALKEVLEKLIPSSGLEHLEWEIHLVNAPGKFRTRFFHACTNSRD
jgi:hypothetical protein